MGTEETIQAFIIKEEWQQQKQSMVSKNSIHPAKGKLAALHYLDQMKVTKKTRKTKYMESVSMITGCGSVVSSKSKM